MAIKFMTSSIKVGKSPTFAEIVERKMKKEATTEQPVVKTAAKEEEKEADSSGQPEAEGKLTNNPKVEKEEAPKAAKKESKKEGDEAPSSGQTDVEPLHQKGESVKPSAITCENKKTEAKTTETFVKVAKLNPKTKEWLKSYWSTLYPAAYVEAMLADN